MWSHFPADLTLASDNSGMAFTRAGIYNKPNLIKWLWPTKIEKPQGSKLSGKEAYKGQIKPIIDPWTKFCPAKIKKKLGTIMIVLVWPLLPHYKKFRIWVHPNNTWHYWWSVTIGHKGVCQSVTWHFFQKFWALCKSPLPPPDAHGHVTSHKGGRSNVTK
jgi:hypothetical protein